jgi:hypothetical protein
VFNHALKFHCHIISVLSILCCKTLNYREGEEDEPRVCESCEAMAHGKIDDDDGTFHCNECWEHYYGQTE